MFNQLIQQRVRWILLLLTVGAALLAFLFWKTNYQQKFHSAQQAFAQWRMNEAESLLETFTQHYPERLEAKRLYASTLLRRGELRKARGAFAALAQSDSIHLLSLSLIHFYLGNLDTSAALARHFVAGTDLTAARACNVLGRIAFNNAEFDSAFTFQRQSQRLARTNNSAHIEAEALRQIGVLFWYEGKTDSARALYESALRLYRAVNDKIGEATTLNNIGLLDSDIRLFLQAFAIRKTIGDQIGLADSYYFITFGLGGHWLDELFSFLKKSRDVSRRIGYRWGEEVARRALEDFAVNAHDSLRFDPFVTDSTHASTGEQMIHRLKRRSSELARNGQWREAAALRERIVALCDSLGYRIGLAGALGMQVAALLPLGDYDKAEAAARRLQQLLAGDPIRADWKLAEVFLASGKYDDAVQLLASIASRLDGDYLRRLNQKDLNFPLIAREILIRRFEAYDMLMTAMKHRVSGASENSSTENLTAEKKKMGSRRKSKKSFSATSALSAAENTQGFFNDASNLEKIFETLERFRSLPFGFGVERGVSLETAGDESIWHRYARTVEAMERDPEQIESLLKEFDDAYTAAKQQRTEAQHASLNLYRTTLPRLADVQAALAENQVLVEYFIGKEEAFVLAVRRDARQFLPLVATSAHLNSSRRALRDLLLRAKASPNDSLWNGPASYLFRSLIQPIISTGMLNDGDHLIISPQGILTDVPFACLADSSGNLLIERFIVSCVPSAYHLLTQRADQREPSFIALVPDRKSLPFAEREVAHVSRTLFPSQNILLDDDASTSALLDNAATADVIHIAAHGFMHRWHPLFSPLKLSDGNFELHRILRLKLNARLVVVSACETGYGVGMLGDVAEGHHAVSFAQAFLSAGAASVIAPLWIVEDEATSLLMQKFYSHLATIQKTSHPLAVALARSQRDVLTSFPQKRHPFFWAGFYLSGAGE